MIRGKPVKYRFTKGVCQMAMRDSFAKWPAGGDPAGGALKKGERKEWKTAESGRS